MSCKYKLSTGCFHELAFQDCEGCTWYEEGPDREKIRKILENKEALPVERVIDEIIKEVR